MVSGIILRGCAGRTHLLAKHKYTDRPHISQNVHSGIVRVHQWLHKLVPADLMVRIIMYEAGANSVAESFHLAICSWVIGGRREVVRSLTDCDRHKGLGYELQLVVNQYMPRYSIGDLTIIEEYCPRVRACYSNDQYSLCEFHTELSSNQHVVNAGFRLRQ